MTNIGKRTVLVLAGFAAGVAFIVACGSSGEESKNFGPGNAAAQAGCTQYQVQILDTSGATGAVNTLPAGWVPFAVRAADSAIAAFRCAQ